MELHQNTYHIQGVSIDTLCKQFGTPLYIYDANTIVGQVNRLKKAFEGTDVKIKFAAKALPNISVLALLQQNGVGVDAVSVNEARIAISAGHQPGNINFTPSCADFSEIAEAVDLGLNVNLDSIPVLEKFGKHFGNSYPCGIRLNPHIMAGGNLKISTGHIHSKFGISSQQLDEIKEVIRKHNIVLHGLHIHTGSEISDAEVFTKMADIFFGIAADFPHLKFIDFGGGFKVAYREGDKVTDLDSIGRELRSRFDQFALKTGRRLELWIEPGKFLVSESGILVAKTTVVKETPALTFVGVDTGLNHLIRPMMYNAYHEIINLSNPQGSQKKYTIVGNICETDTLGSDRDLSEVRDGDLIGILNAGAYGYSMASNYNSRLRPAEVLIVQGVPKLIRDRDNLEDLLRGQKNVFS